MSDGYIETAQELLMFLKHVGLADNDADAVDAVTASSEAIVREQLNLPVSEELRLKRLYFSGIVHGITIAAEATKMTLKAKRFEEGRDPETGQPMRIETQS